MIDGKITRKKCERNTMVRRLKGGKVLTGYKLTGVLLDTRVHETALVVGAGACTGRKRVNAKE